VPLTVVGPAPLLDWDRDSLTVELPTLGPTRVGLRGRHQAANVAVADALLDALAIAGIASVDADARRRGYADVRWPGRLELLEVEGHEVLLDGAHNPAGAGALAAALTDLRPFLVPGPITLLTASMADKDVAGVVAALAASPALAGATVVCVALDVPRALPADDLAAIWRGVVPSPARVETAGSVEAGVQRALAVADGPVVVAGSLYLVGAVRGAIVHDDGP
jgi:dihydrofolate synthase/folylpolyglutamate synthase